MLSRWPIRNKLLVGISLLSIIIAILSFSSFRGVYAYRGLAKSISGRVTELPLASELARRINDLRMTLSQTRRLADVPLATQEASTRILREEFRGNFVSVQDALLLYREQLSDNRRFDHAIGDDRDEWETARKMERSLERIDRLNQAEDWMLNDVQVSVLSEELDLLHQLSSELPSFLHNRFLEFAGDVRSQYRVWIMLAWASSASTVLLVVLTVHLFYTWVFRPLRVLIKGSRRVATGDFNHQIQLCTRDEMSELAEAMNAMTTRFRNIRDDLDRQVELRTKQVVRSEQLASVGFLAAGVAHEINNPLASIALCSESLESRLHDIMQQDDEKSDGEHNEEITITRNYLRMIQDEAFRCKEITEKLLDFSRPGEAKRQTTDMVELVSGVIEMIGHFGRYKEKNIVLHTDEPVVAPINSAEIKQVVVNVITNGLDSLEAGGTIQVEVRTQGEMVEMLVTDNGCGMTDEVLQHLFDPFFTRRRDGKGTGLGLSISYRIINEHGGHIDASSEGPGTGSQIRILLPLVTQYKETDNQYQAA